MRTKTLLLTAAALVASAATIMAQSNVYSLNVVGYVNVTIAPNSFAQIANQLDTTNNTIGALIPVAPDGAQLFKYKDATGYTTYTYDALTPGWLPNGNATLNPGEGAFMKNNTSSNLVITFVGDVKQGSLTNALPAGYGIRSSIVPQAGTLTDLGLTGAVKDGDQVFIYAGKYTTYTYDSLTPGWIPGAAAGPNVDVGQAFFMKGTGGNWVRNFTVN